MGEGGVYGSGYMGENSTPDVFRYITNGILDGWELSGKIAGILVIDDIETIIDPDASTFDKGLAAAGFLPLGKLIKGGKIVVKLANKEKEIEVAVEATDTAIQAAAKLSNKQIKHILNGHMPDTFAKQVNYMPEADFTKYLEDNTFFNSSWTKEDIISGVETAYQSAFKDGVTGRYDYYYNGEYIRLFIDSNGNLSSAYGLNKLTKSYFGK
ncbi:hypothetical protein ASG93_29325 [Paenibacillus sp. Soil787]|nr:hypothetical protein ASG93_29325 [Paenibacillus sp. Soil787]